MYLYQNANSIFHTLHPLTKLLLLFLMITASLLSKQLPMTSALLFLYIVLLLIGGGFPNLMKFKVLLILFWIFTFFIWIIIPKLRHLPWSYENSAMLATRIDSFVIAGLLFVTITRIEEFTYALERLGIPYRVAFALSLGFRLMPLFYGNLQTIVAAQRARGVDLESGGFLHRAAQYVPILGVLISYGIRNADLMAVSLESKGFGYPGKRTSLFQPVFGFRDVVALAALLTLIALSIFLGR